MTTTLNDIEERAHLYIDGEWVLPDSSQTIEVIDARGDEIAQYWSRETGVLYSTATQLGGMAEHTLNGYADLADSFSFEESGLTSMWGGTGMVIREPVGVVGAIYPWNGALEYILHKAGPALLAGCTVVMKSPSQAPGELFRVLGQALQAHRLHPPGDAHRRRGEADRGLLHARADQSRPAR